MPIHKVGSKWEWGSGHGTFDSEAGAERQERAARANGYTGKGADPLDRVIGLTAMLAKAGNRHYLKEGEKPPVGVQVKEGTRGGKYIEIGDQTGHTDDLDAMDANGLQEAADKLKKRKADVLDIAQQLEPDDPEAAREQMKHWNRLDAQHEMVKDRIRAKVREGGPAQPQPQPQHIKVPQLDAHGKPKQDVRPEFQAVADELAGDGLAAEDQGIDDDSLRIRAAGLQQMLEHFQQNKAPLADVMRVSDRLRRIREHLEGGDEKPAAGKLGPQAQAVMGEFEQLQEKLKAGELENPQELVDAARRVAQAYEGDRQQLGQGDVQKRALQEALDDATKKHERGKELFESWKQRFEYARDKGAPAEEVKAARERMDAAEDEYHDARMGVHNAEKALHHYTRGGQQPQPAPAAAAPAAPAHAGEARFPLGGAWDRPQAEVDAQREKERAERKARAASADAKVPKVPEGPKKGQIGRVAGQFGAFGAEPRDFGPDELFPGEWQAEKAAWKAGKNWVIRGPGGYRVADEMPAQGGDFMRIRPDGIVEHYRGKVKGAKAPKAGNPGGSTPAAFAPAGKHHAEKELAKLGKEPDFAAVRAMYDRARGGGFVRDLQAKHPDWTKMQLSRYWKAYYKAIADAYAEAWRRKRDAGG